MLKSNKFSPKRHFEYSEHTNAMLKIEILVPLIDLLGHPKENFYLRRDVENPSLYLPDKGRYIY